LRSRIVTLGYWEWLAHSSPCGLLSTPPPHQRHLLWPPFPKRR